MLIAPSSRPESSNRQVPLLPRGYGLPFVLVTTLFFLWGIPNNLNDVLIRQFMKSFVMSRFEAGPASICLLHGLFPARRARSAGHEEAGLQIGVPDRPSALQPRDRALLARSHGGALFLLPCRALHHCQRPLVSRDRFESLRRPIG